MISDEIKKMKAENNRLKLLVEVANKAWGDYDSLRYYLSLTVKGRQLLSRFDKENANEK